MAVAWNKADRAYKPSPEIISFYVSSPLWENLCLHIEEQYQAKPVIEYSGCSVPGWNVKYRKSGRSLCTLYPMKGYFVALIVISERERIETELNLPFFTEYMQDLYHETKTGMGQKWLMLDVKDESVLNDVKQLIAIRRGIKNR